MGKNQYFQITRKGPSTPGDAPVDCTHVPGPQDEPRSLLPRVVARSSGRWEQLQDEVPGVPDTHTKPLQLRGDEDTTSLVPEMVVSTDTVGVGVYLTC